MKEVIIIIILIIIVILLFKSNSNLRFQLRSKSVKFGYSFEQLIPFMKGLKYNPDNMKYLGKPIDYVVFDNNKVVFLEVKTGSSQLNDNEINLKRLIDNKQVYYEVIRI